jgi:hypothetical protein
MRRARKRSKQRNLRAAGAQSRQTLSAGVAEVQHSCQMWRKMIKYADSSSLFCVFIFDPTHKYGNTFCISSEHMQTPTLSALEGQTKVTHAAHVPGVERNALGASAFPAFITQSCFHKTVIQDG